jgi:glyoxylase-like metal-dependent hydrolase (beta-lactamase superfamily II)
MINSKQGIYNMKFKKFVLPYINSNMYIGIEDGHAIIIDPNISSDGFEYLNNSNIKDGVLLLTHEHFDHTTGVNRIKELFPCKLICQTKCAESISNKAKNRPLSLLLINHNEDPKAVRSFFNQFELYECKADIAFDDSYEFLWYSHNVRLTSTPGHSKGSICIDIDNNMVFTGDTLIPDIPVITRYPGGSMDEYKNITLPYLMHIEKSKYIYPGHGDPCCMDTLEYIEDVFCKSK